MKMKQKLLKIVENAKGDNLERAERMFYGITNAELDKQYGQSKKKHGDKF